MEKIELHPIYNRFCYYNDHFHGQLQGLGDALGRDCMIASFSKNNITWASTYRGDGLENEDWYGWRADVMAPIQGIVKKVYVNPVTNKPGEMIPGIASHIIIENEFGVHVELAHIQEPIVKENDFVKEGQIIAKVGNNGYSRNPHVHIGAWIDDKPLSIEFNSVLVAEAYQRVGEIYWLFGMTEEEFNQSE